ncbi:MAG: hypothetical protein ACE5RA_05640 [Nitrosopumilus sp.]
MDFHKLFSDVLKIDSGIRYAAVQNNAGMIITGGFRENITATVINSDSNSIISKILKLINHQ